jgi:ABC-type multidrug transport system fused ATPase/permease subunit
MEQIKIKDLTFFYNKQEKPAIENLSFKKREILLCCAENQAAEKVLF